jgi:hypothetical protein
MLFDFIDDLIDKIKKPVYMSLVFIVYASYLLTYFGLFYISPDYVKTVNFIVQSFVCFILIYRFNPLRESILRKDDNIIIFGSSIIIFINLVSIELLRLYKEKNETLMYILENVYRKFVGVFYSYDE